MSHILFCPKILSSFLLRVLCIQLKLGIFTGFMSTLRICDVLGFKTCYQTLERPHETQSCRAATRLSWGPWEAGSAAGAAGDPGDEGTWPHQILWGQMPPVFPNNNLKHMLVKVRRVVMQRGQLIWEGFGMGSLIMCGNLCYLWGALTFGNDSLPSTAWPRTMVNESS